MLRFKKSSQFVEYSDGLPNIVSARDVIYNMSESEVWDAFTGYDDNNDTPVFDLNVTFDNGTITLSNRRLILSWYYWLLFRQSPGVPVISEYCINEEFTKKTHLTFGSKIFWFTYYEYQTKRYGENVDIFLINDGLQWDMAKLFYEITNLIYNFYRRMLSEYAVMITIDDVIEILDIEEIKEVKERETAKCIDSDYNYDICLSSINLILCVESSSI